MRITNELVPLILTSLPHHRLSALLPGLASDWVGRGGVDQASTSGGMFYPRLRFNVFSVRQAHMPCRFSVESGFKPGTLRIRSPYLTNSSLRSVSRWKENVSMDLMHRLDSRV
ncbi:hypothetical protein AVEN_117509-1 [Araneus ventricosus]|uniref:Uncharacterized protein n=1 Tax=Araneus ventricosus TaxID=182803 RepID=A0A4Y2H2T6_ARAVE|nr:hypothetical protein AVEN_117509-1 [Araneus ventricosus]